MESLWLYNMFAGSEPPKFRGSPNISLTKYQLSVFLCLLFAEKINSLLVNQQKNSQLKLVLRSWKKSKQNLVKKIFGDHQIFWWFGSREHVTSHVITPYFSSKYSQTQDYLKHISLHPYQKWSVRLPKNLKQLFCWTLSIWGKGAGRNCWFSGFGGNLCCFRFRSFRYYFYFRQLISLPRPPLYQQYWRSRP